MFDDGCVLTLRRMTEADLVLMHRWAHAPHVARWWREDGTLDEVRANFLPMIDGEDPTVPLIIELSGTPIGHAQWCRWGDFPEDGVRFDADPDEYCIDYFIGDPDLCGRGVGTALIAELVRAVNTSVDGTGATPIGFLVDVEEANTASCRVLEKNGFTRLPDPHPDRETDDRSGPTVLFRRRW